MSQDFFYPPGSSNVINIASEGPNTAPIPTSSTLIGGENPSLNLIPLQVDATGHLLTVAAAGSLQDVNLIKVSGVAITLGQKAMAASLPVVISSDQSTLPISAASLPLPAGSATSANQATEIASLASIDGKLTSPLTVSVNNFPGTQPVSGTVAVTQSTSPWIVDGSGFTQPVSGVFFQATQPISGTVAVSNFPGTQPVSGTVTANQGTSPWVVSGTVAVSGTVTTSGTATSTSATTSGTVTQAAVAVGVTAVRCTVSGSAPSASRKALIVEPDPASTAKFYIGSSSVASSGASRGIPLAPGAQFIANFDASDFYIISDTAAQTFFVVEEV